MCSHDNLIIGVTGLPINYEDATQTVIADAMKMSKLLNRVQGDIRAHLLWTADMKNPDFNKATKIHNEFSAGLTHSKENAAKANPKNNTEKEKDKTDALSQISKK
eukprot:1267337-Amphidinium_carterae.2